MLFGRRIDIYSKKRGAAGRLSNFTRRDFTFDGVRCRSIEGVLQSFKFESESEQRIVCGLWGIQAKLAGEGRDWKTSQTLYWRGKSYLRDSGEYAALVSRLYMTAYDQDEQLRRDVKKAARRGVCHSIGGHDPKETVLTEEEFVGNLLMLSELAE